MSVYPLCPFYVEELRKKLICEAREFDFLKMEDKALWLSKHCSNKNYKICKFYDLAMQKYIDWHLTHLTFYVKISSYISFLQSGGILMFDAKKVKDECVNWIKDFFNKNGKDCNGVIAISGGKDSSVVAALLVEALGKNRVIGVLMPNGNQHDISCSYDLVNHLGIKYYEVNIEKAYKGIIDEVSKSLELTNQSITNLPPRIRMSVVYAVSQSVNGRVANTCNLSEDYVGYSTRYGDSVGDFSPLSHLTVTEVKKIGYELNLPKHLIEKPPIDGLSGKTDEDNLGFTYEVLDRYIRDGEIDDENIKNIIDTKHKNNLFKLELMPSFKPKF